MKYALKNVLGSDFKKEGLVANTVNLTSSVLPLKYNVFEPTPTNPLSGAITKNSCAPPPVWICKLLLTCAVLKNPEIVTI
jgi:hypothetical protein